uniref:Uncharacterized protein n=1 Tax=Anas platyrhynchos platyrhynchos TaxID=8840 RepID=A0A493U2W8_ANAPP
MQLPAVCCRAWLLLLVLRWAGAQAAGGEHGAELRSLQDLLEALGQLRDEEGELALDEEPEAGAEDGGPEWDLPGTPLPAPSPTEPAEGQSRWRSLLSSSRRRHFSGCFGTRMERIGAQTGLGCNHYRARRSRLRRRTGGQGGPPPGSSHPTPQPIAPSVRGGWDEDVCSPVEKVRHHLSQLQRGLSCDRRVRAAHQTSSLSGFVSHAGHLGSVFPP